MGHKTATLKCYKMSDDLERKLDEFYRGFDESAGRVEARWKGASLRPARSPAAWVGLGLAGAAGLAAAVLVLVWVLQPTPASPPGDVTVGDRRLPPRLPTEPDPAPGAAAARPSEPPPTPSHPPPAVPPKPPEPRADPSPVPRPEAPTPALPAPEPPRPEPPKPTTAERAVAVLRETEGSFELGDRPVRTRQKDLRVAAGEVLRASTVAKLVLADDRFLLLAPRTSVELRPEGEGLALHLDQGELLAELVGPGPAVRVTTRACEVKPLGTVFSVKADKGRTSVTVEKGRVEVRNGRGSSTPRAGELVVTPEDGAPSTPAPTDLRAHLWARSHRPPERSAFLEEFVKAGAWSAEVEKGVAKGIPAPGLCASKLEVSSDKPPLFEVPARGQIVIVYRTDRAAKMFVQFFAPDLRVNFRKDVQVLRGTAWRTLTLDFDEFSPTLKDRYSGKVTPGVGVTTFGIYYGEGEERGSIWVDSVRVVELRP
jgi:ferric-dicitrate binding protein FerR (iron transport regulator)